MVFIPATGLSRVIPLATLTPTLRLKLYLLRSESLPSFSSHNISLLRGSNGFVDETVIFDDTKEYFKTDNLRRYEELIAGTSEVAGR
jgi:hypothetical protein